MKTQYIHKLTFFSFIFLISFYFSVPALAKTCKLSLLGSCDTKGFAYAVYISGNKAYVADFICGLQIIDISNPKAPALLGSYDTPGGAKGVYVSGNTAYVADGASGLQIINVSDPRAPTLLGNYDTPGSARNVFVSGNTAYVADFDSLQIVDVSNPAKPMLLGCYDTLKNAVAKDVYLSGTKAYVAAWADGLLIIDVSNPKAPILLGSYDTPGDAMGIYISDNTAYVADGNLQLTVGGVLSGLQMEVLGGGLQIIDVSNPKTPTLLGSCNIPSSAKDIYVSGGVAYIVADEGNLTKNDDGNFELTSVPNPKGGLQIIDVSNSKSPVWLGSYDTPGIAWSVFVSSNTPYVVDVNSGLRIIRCEWLQSN